METRPRTIIIHEYSGHSKKPIKIYKDDGTTLIEGDFTLEKEEINNLKQITDELSKRQSEDIEILSVVGKEIKKTYSYVGTLSLSEKTNIIIKPRKMSDMDWYFMRNYLLTKSDLEKWDEFRSTIEKTTPITQSSDSIQFGLTINMRYILSQIQNITKTGLLTKYVEETEESQFLKGKTLWTKSFNKGYFPTEKLFNRFSYLTTDIPENRILKKTLEIFYRLTKHQQTKNEILKQLNLHFFNISDPESLHQKITYDSLNKRYQSTIIRCEEIINKTNFLYDVQGNIKNNYGDLTDLNLLFESFIAVFLKEHITQKIYSQTYDDNIRYIESDKPYLRWEQKPDIIIDGPNNNTIIIDTKNKKLYKDNKKNIKPLTDDLIQMLSYANFLHTEAGTPLKTQEIILLYPDSRPEEQYYEYNIKNNINAKQTTKITQTWVDLSRYELNRSLHKLLGFLSTKGIRIKPSMSDSHESCGCIISNAQLQKIHA